MRRLVRLTLALLVAALGLAPGCRGEPEFQMSNLTMSPAEVFAGDPLLVSVEVTNTGRGEGDYPIILRVDGVQVDSEIVTLKPGATERVYFTFRIKGAGPHTLAANHLTTTFTALGR